MNTVSSNRKLVGIIAFLVLVNLVMLAYFLWFKKTACHAPDNANKTSIMIGLLKQNVGFNDTQILAYKKLRDERKQIIHPLLEEMQTAKESLFRLIADSTIQDTTIQAAANAIAIKQKQLDLLTYEHFKQIRQLCSSPNQQVKYDSIVPKLFRIMIAKPMNKEDRDKSKH